jgi:hypothetical protein
MPFFVAIHSPDATTVALLSLPDEGLEPFDAEAFNTREEAEAAAAETDAALAFGCTIFEACKHPGS